jgi:hypothetical protein
MSSAKVKSAWNYTSTASMEVSSRDKPGICPPPHPDKKKSKWKKRKKYTNY